MLSYCPDYQEIRRSLSCNIQQLAFWQYGQNKI